MVVLFLDVNMPSAYNLILRRPAQNTFQAVVSTYHMKLKFPVGTQVGKVKGDHYMGRKCYVEVIRDNSGKMDVDPPNKEVLNVLSSMMIRKTLFLVVFSRPKS
ncbi:UNVERIFIED_CONTAM: hypothetical protein Sradi_0856200 [Sesamum radiatum]|uniref:Uncharacterized protein n=1 Tax=Sesamum radiatum TaxID=300843 RepID=A0AAW2V199_SESRA